MDVDYSTSPTVGSSLTPINFNQLIEGIATRAQVQDYYYNLQRHIIPRYLGSKTTAAIFNEYTNGDTGYGKEVVAGNPKPFVGYYQSKGGSTPEVIGKTIVNLDYIIDENIQTQVPALSDFTYNNQIQLFERGKYLYLDPDKNSISKQFAGVNKYEIYRSGEYATPILYTQTGSNPSPIGSLNFKNPEIDEIEDYYNSFIPFYPSTGVVPGGSLFYLYYNLLSLNPPLTRWPVRFDDTFVLPPETGYIDGVSNSFLYGITFQDIKEFRYISPPPTPLNITITNKAKVTLKVRNLTGTSISPNLSATTLNLTILIYKRNNTPTKSFRGLPASGWIFPDYTPYPDTPFTSQWEVLPNTTKTITVETEILSATTTHPAIFIQGRVTPQGYNPYGPNASYLQSLIQSPYFSILSTTLEIIQVPQENQTEIEYTPPIGNSSGNPYITYINDSTNGINSGATTTSDIDFYSGNIPCSQIYFNPSFIPALGKIYPQVPGSGYDATIYPFEILPNSIFETTTTPEYEIRFNADENLVFPIIGSYAGEFDGDLVFWLIVGRPEGYSLQDNIVGEARQSFLIRRWIPKAGYIYLEADDPPNGLGKGIIRPEYITKEIQEKIPSIVKDLTDKNLIQ
jgi:hypothetical protein